MALTHGRRTVAFTTVMALAAGLMAAPSSAAAHEPPAPIDRRLVVSMWQAGGSVLKPAAERALLGSDDDVRAFLGKVEDLQDIDDRVTANQIFAQSGPTVRREAQRALDTDTVADFLTSGWQEASHIDQRIRVNQMFAAGGTQVKAAARRALDADDADSSSRSAVDGTPSGPLDAFVASGWRAPLEVDQRVQVTQIFAKAPPKSNVHRLAQRALDADDAEALTAFLDSGYAVAASRDAEAGAIADLVASAERAGIEAAQHTETAKDEGVKAAGASAAAKASAQDALAAMERAGDNADEAAAAASRAAVAAGQAARAAGQAMAAAQSAVAACRVAAKAAARAATVAALTRRAANRANKAAADAAVNKDKSQTAKDLAKAALDIAKQARASAVAVDKAVAIAVEAGNAAAAATAAGADSNAAVAAAESALTLARKTGAHVDQAMAAARRARNQALRANRAAAASIAFARTAAAAAGSARDAANRAADDANAAAAAANAAAGHAGDAAKAAQAAMNAANAAAKAADDAVTSANDAFKVYEAARAVDAARLAIASEEGADSAAEALAAYEAYKKRVDWDAHEAVKRDAETTRLIAEVRNPAADRSQAISAGRRVTLTLSTTGGPHTQEQALAALGGTDDDVVAFVRGGIDMAAAEDDRATVTTLALTGTKGMHVAAEAALAGSDAQVAQFLVHQDYAERATEDRVAVNRVLARARADENPVIAERAARALDGSDAAVRAFLTDGQFDAAEVDERIKVNQIFAGAPAGTELRAAAKNAQDGPPGALHEFLTTGRHIAQQNDYDAQVHDGEMLALLARAAGVAATAQRDAEEARAVAETARGKADEAKAWLDKAVRSAERAGREAQRADAAAKQAEESADKAAHSANAAVKAADTANKAAAGATRFAAAAQDSYEQAKGSAREAVDAANRAGASALAAGRNAAEVASYRTAAYRHANDLAEMEYNHARQQQYIDCLKDSGPIEEFQHECGKVFEPDGIRIAKATLNRQFCTKFSTVDQTYYQNCVADSFNPNFMLNRSLDLMQAGTIVLTSWGILTMAGIGASTLFMVCAAVCTAMGTVLGGAEASMGIGGMFTVWAEGSLMSYVTGGAAGAYASARVMGGVKGALDKFRIPAVFQRVIVPSKALNANFARLIAKTYPRCLTKASNSFAPGTPVLLADGTGKAIKDVQVGDLVLATDPVTGVTDAQQVTHLIAGTGHKQLVDITIDSDGPGGDPESTITTTHNHPFWVADRHAWADAAELIPGQYLRTSAGTWVQVSALHRYSQYAAVHNLAVAGHHTYYVVAGKAPVLVHNEAPCLDLALGLQEYGLREWAEKNRYTHFLNVPYPDWLTSVERIISAGQATLRVRTDGFAGADATARFTAAALAGVMPGRAHTQREMAWIARSVYLKDREWSTIKFYLGDEVVTVREPGDWWNLVPDIPANKKAKAKWQSFLDYPRWERENP